LWFHLTARSAVTASSLYLARFQKAQPELLAKPSATIIAPSYIDPTARIAASAKIGPNVAIGPGVQIEDGVRVKDAIIMEGSTLEKHSCVLNSIVGTNCHIGPWARVDGAPEPEQDVKGQISVTVLGELSPQAGLMNSNRGFPGTRNIGSELHRSPKCKFTSVYR
jgi:mannose-1-phosphate guanylyltransferase